MRILSIDLVDCDTDDEFVYDLETEAGTFLAGSMESGLMVKNTDSCFVDFRMILRMNYASEEEFMQAHFNQAIECAKHCTSMFKAPVKLEFEKVMYPLMLFSRKRYAFKKWKSPDKPCKEPEHKGTQVVRKDICDFVKNNLRECFNFVLNSTSVAESHARVKEIVRGAVKSLMDGTADLEGLILTRQLKSTYKVNDKGEADDADDGSDDEHPSHGRKALAAPESGPGSRKSIEVHWTDPRIKTAHVRLAQTLALRDAFNHPKPPDRVPYVFYDTGSMTGPQCDRVASPVDIIEGRLKIDGMYYMTSQFEKPFGAFLEIIGLDSSIYSDLVRDKINSVQKQNSITKYMPTQSKAPAAPPRTSASRSKNTATEVEDTTELILKKPEPKKRGKSASQSAASNTKGIDGYFTKTGAA